MNEVAVRVVAVSNGFEGWFRRVHKAAWEPVMINGVAQLYADARDAEIAAWRALKAHLQGEIVGTGGAASAARSKAEDLFGAVFRNGRKIAVERRRNGKGAS